MSRVLKSLFALACAVSLSACQSTTIASRSNQNPPTITMASQGSVQVPGPKVMASQYNVTNVAIAVPRKLKVSEANVFYPVADIVWRGEPRGDRHGQVASIFQEAMQAGTGSMTKGRDVVVEIEVTRFHCLTEKTRYTVGGVHSLEFELTVRDVQSGAVIDGPRIVLADVKAAGGAQAIAEEQMGRTQRVVVVDRLAQVIRRELSRPETMTPELAARLASDAVVRVSTSN